MANHPVNGLEFLNRVCPALGLGGDVVALRLDLRVGDPPSIEVTHPDQPRIGMKDRDSVRICRDPSREDVPPSSHETLRLMDIICKAIGLDDPRIQRLVIEAHMDDVARVNCTFIGDSGLRDLDWAAVARCLPPEIRCV